MSLTRTMRFVFAALVSTIAMGAAVSSAQAATGASVTNGVTLASANGPLTLTAGSVTIICNATLGLNLNQSTAKRVGTQIGSILLSGSGSTISGCNLGVTGVVLNGIMRRALAGGPLYLYRNQNCIRDFVYIDDAIRAICAAATSEKIEPGAKYIIGSGEGFSLREIITEIATKVSELREQSVEVHLDDEAPLQPIEWRNFVADYTRFQSATGWKPLVKLSQGLDFTLSAFTGGQMH